jgi:transposase
MICGSYAAWTKKTRDTKRWSSLHERRKQVIRLHKRGIKVMELVQMSGLSYPAVRKVLDLFEQGGWPAIKPAGRGRDARATPACSRQSKKPTFKRPSATNAPSS